MAYEDFTTYTEVDVGADRIQVIANHIDHLSLRNEDTYVYKDHGAGHFDNYDIDIDFRSDYSQNRSVGDVAVISDALDDACNIEALGNENEMIHIYMTNLGQPTINARCHDGVAPNQDTYNSAANTWYYLTIVKSGGVYTVKVYSDSARTTLLDTLVASCSAAGKKYIYPVNSWNSGTAEQQNLDSDNLDLNEAVAAAHKIPNYFNADFVPCEV